MIVIEGADMVGKTTLAQELFKRIPKELHLTPMARHFTKTPDYFDRYWGYVNCCQRDVIVDRLHLSHLVYSLYNGQELDMCNGGYELVDAKIAQHGGVVVVIAPPNETITRRWQRLARQEMYNLDTVLKINDVFRIVCRDRELRRDGFTFRPKMDLIFVEDEPVSHIADRVMTLWMMRQRLIDEVSERRPAVL